MVLTLCVRCQYIVLHANQLALVQPGASLIASVVSAGGCKSSEFALISS